MKSKTFVPILLFVLILPISSSFSQAFRMKPGPGKGPWRSEGQCWSASDLNLTQDQGNGLEAIQKAYFRETQLLRAEIFSKRLEVRDLLTNPTIKLEAIRAKYSEIVNLQAKLEERIIDYLIKTRNLLTQEQLKHWCPELEFPLSRRAMHGLSRMGPMTPRKPPWQEGLKEE